MMAAFGQYYGREELGTSRRVGLPSAFCGVVLLPVTRFQPAVAPAAPARLKGVDSDGLWGMVGTESLTRRNIGTGGGVAARLRNGETKPTPETPARGDKTKRRAKK
jgi:hypothetical protein